MGLTLSIGGLEFRIEGASPVLEAAMERYAPFVVPEDSQSTGDAPIVIHARGRMGGAASTCDPLQPIGLSLRGCDEIVLSGGAQGSYHLAARRGFVGGDTGFGPLDALVRVALSTALPLEGSLLLHAAALRRSEGDGVALCGASGTGKSTANSFLGGGCDELAVLHLEPGGDVELLSTPFWHGRRFRERCTEVFCLHRSREARTRRLRGTAAVRLLARHVIRYVVHPEVERAVFALITNVCDQLPVLEAGCPEGDAFIPYLTERLGWKEAM